MGKVGLESGEIKDRPEFIHVIIERMARERAHEIAVRCGDDTLTYDELSRRSSFLALRMAQEGVVPGDIVAILLERSVEIVVSILAVLKAGAAFLPLDPHYPEDRLAWMVDDAQVRLVISQSSVSHRFGSIKYKTILVDELAEEGETFPLEPALVDQDPAYVIYTSGSTGRPKGVVISHRNIHFSNQARLEYYSKQPGKFILVASIAVDGALAVIFWTLSTGGELLIAEESERKDVSKISRLIKSHQVTHIMCLPSLYSLLLEEYENLQGLQVVIVAAETCPMELVIRHEKWMPAAELFNEYGPTEATVWCTVYRCRATEIKTIVPIGKAIPCYRVYLLDEFVRPVPEGEKGEIYIAGEGIGLGYLNQPELTSQKFLRDPFHRVEVSRMYRTGDFGRLNQSGEIEFLGRLDGQVKIRGHRVELEEIQSILGKHESVKECVVLPKCDSSAHCCISAFVTLRQDFVTSESDLKLFLQKKVPEFMVPSFFFILDAMPLSPNGKIDRQKLLLMQDSSKTRVFVSPQSPMEIRLADIWKEVLQVDRAGVDDHFFDLGGDSLKALRVVSKIRSHLKIQLSLSEIFNRPTISSLGHYLQTRKPSLSTDA